jgi:hypothetical protein
MKITKTKALDLLIIGTVIPSCFQNERVKLSALNITAKKTTINSSSETIL